MAHFKESLHASRRSRVWEHFQKTGPSGGEPSTAERLVELQPEHHLIWQVASHRMHLLHWLPEATVEQLPDDLLLDQPGVSLVGLG